MEQIVCKAEPELVTCDEPNEYLAVNNIRETGECNTNRDTLDTVFISDIKDEPLKLEYDDVLRTDPLGCISGGIQLDIGNNDDIKNEKPDGDMYVYKSNVNVEISDTKDEPLKPEFDGILKTESLEFGSRKIQSDIRKDIELKIQNEHIEIDFVKNIEESIKQIKLYLNPENHQLQGDFIDKEFNSDQNAQQKENNCNKIVTNNKINYDTHNLKLRIQNDDKPFTCKFCSKKFASKQSCNLHMKTHTGEEPFACKICTKKFLRKRDFERHMKTHTMERPYPCILCNKKFREQSDLDKHMRTHTGEKPFSCKLCDKRFTQTSNYYRHMITHTGEKPFSCKFCPKKFALNVNCNKHMKIHTVDKPFACNFCAEKFASQFNLERHLKSHTKETSFSCELCDAQFTQKSSLIRHIKAHAGNKPFSCKFCTKKFTNYSNCSDHMRTHTREKRFSCDLCSKKFSSKRSCGKHMKIHTVKMAK